MAVDLKFNSMDDFEPAHVVASRCRPSRALLETREKLRDLMSKVDRSEELENLLEQVLQIEDDLKSLSGELGHRKDRRADRWPRRSPPKPAPPRRPRRRPVCLNRSSPTPSRPQPDRAQDLVKNLVEQALAGTVTFDRNLTRTFDKAIAAIDAKMSAQLNAIMHDPKFLKLEGSWRGPALSGA